MNTPTNTSSIKSDVLQAHPHSLLSAEEIAKAVARHKREHPAGKSDRPAKTQKSPPRR
jgi:hypothetical protein